MASSSHSENSDGGSGCTTCLHSHISLKDYLAKVCANLIKHPSAHGSHRLVLAIGQQVINCSPVEFVTIIPPSGQTCGQYMEAFISFAGGYLANPEDSASCQFCSVHSSDQFLSSGFNIFYAHHWRDFGFLMAFIVFNVSYPQTSTGHD